MHLSVPHANPLKFTIGLFAGYRDKHNLFRAPAAASGHIAVWQMSPKTMGFCADSARIITSFGSRVRGLPIGDFCGSFNRITAVMICFAMFNIAAMVLGGVRLTLRWSEADSNRRSPV